MRAIGVTSVGARRLLRNTALGLVVMSFALCSLVVIGYVGISNTPYDTSDSAGRRMGFNSSLSMEHYGILFSNFRIQTLLTPAYAYAWFLLTMHVVGGWLLWHVDRFGVPRIRRFFGMQGLLFPLGWVGFLGLPSMIYSMARGTLDREGIIEGPFMFGTAQPVWIAVSMTIFAASWIGTVRTKPPDQACDPEVAA